MQGLIKWIIFQILKGLETLNSLNIIHREINPKHILVSSSGKIKIIGFSRLINDNQNLWKIESSVPYVI